MAVSRLSQQSIQQSFPKGNTIWDGTTATSAFDSLGNYVVGTEAPTTITFSNIPQTYTHLELRILAKHTTAASTIDNATMTLNGVSTGNLYSGHYVRGDGSATGSSVGYANLNNVFTAFWAPSANTTSMFGAGIVEIWDYTNPNKFKVVKSFSGADTNGAGTVSLSSACYRSKLAITSLAISGMTFGPYTTISLYGVK